MLKFPMRVNDYAGLFGKTSAQINAVMRQSGIFFYEGKTNRVRPDYLKNGFFTEEKSFYTNSHGEKLPNIAICITEVGSRFVDEAMGFNATTNGSRLHPEKQFIDVGTLCRFHRIDTDAFTNWLIRREMIDINLTPIGAFAKIAATEHFALANGNKLFEDSVAILKMRNHPHTFAILESYVKDDRN